MTQTTARTKPAQVRGSLKTAAQVKAEFAERGVSVAKWAKQHKVHRQLVYEILSGRNRACLRGQSHRVAVLLGLKHGQLSDLEDTSAMNAVPDRIAA
jgi:gp16 family phage-associated protein